MATKPGPQEKVMNLTEARQHFSQVINQVARGESRVVVEKSGAPVAAIISPEEYSRYKAQEERRRAARSRFLEQAEKFSDAFKDVPEEEIEAELEAIRAERKHDHP